MLRTLAKFTLPDFIGKMTIDELDAFLERSQAEFRKKHPHADRNKAITGNPYYKLDGEKIYCLDCGQRLGMIILPCPICGANAAWVYESMLNNPADQRWRGSRYIRRAISSQQEAALYSLKDRQGSLELKEGDL